MDQFFFSEYFSKIEDPEKLRNLTDKSVSNGRGNYWAQVYYDTHFKTHNNLLNNKFEDKTINYYNPIYSEIINFLNL